MRWESVAEKLKPCERPVVLNRASSTNTTNPFGSTFCYGYQDIIFEVRTANSVSDPDPNLNRDPENSKLTEIRTNQINSHWFFYLPFNFERFRSYSDPLSHDMDPRVKIRPKIENGCLLILPTNSRKSGCMIFIVLYFSSEASF